MSFLANSNKLASGMDPKGPLPDSVPLPEPLWFPTADVCEASSFVTNGGTQWYPAAMVGAEAMARRLTSDGTYVRRALDLMGKLEPDDYTSYMAKFYRAGLRTVRRPVGIRRYRYHPAWLRGNPAAEELS